jgi:hypothetical protein
MQFESFILVNSSARIYTFITTIVIANPYIDGEEFYGPTLPHLKIFTVSLAKLV